MPEARPVVSGGDIVRVGDRVLIIARQSREVDAGVQSPVMRVRDIRREAIVVTVVVEKADE